MSIDTVSTDAEILADAEAVVASLAAGNEVDTAIARRIHARSVQIRERIMREHGTLNIAVPSIRELRDA